MAVTLLEKELLIKAKIDQVAMYLTLVAMFSALTLYLSCSYCANHIEMATNLSLGDELQPLSYTSSSNDHCVASATSGSDASSWGNSPNLEST